MRRGIRRNVTATQAKRRVKRDRYRPIVTAHVVGTKRRGMKPPADDPAAAPLFGTIRRLERLAEDRRQETLKLEAQVASDEKRLAAQQSEIRRLMAMIARGEAERRVVESAVFPALETMIRKLAADLVDARLTPPGASAPVASGMSASAAVAAGTIIAGLGPILSALRPGAR